MALLNVADVAKLVDALDLGSSAARRESSSLSIRTKIYEMAPLKMVPFLFNSLQINYFNSVTNLTWFRLQNSSLF